MAIWWEHLRRLMLRPAYSHASLPDLRELESTRVRLHGTHYLVNDPERSSVGGRLYVLRREKSGTRGRSAIAVFAQGRNVGYVPEQQAAPLAPLLDRLGGAALVNGAGTSAGSIQLWMDLPTVTALREFVTSHERA